MNEESVISAESGASGVSIEVDILGLRGVKLGGKGESSALNFDVNAKLEEKERRSGRLVVGFVLTVGTKPSVVKFEIEGVATLKGKNPAIERLLEVDPKTKIPSLLHNVYQRVFMSTFLLATLLDTTYPPPDLLFSGEMNKPGLEEQVGWEEKKKVEEKPKEKKKKKPVKKGKAAVKRKKKKARRK
ncbi:hypothetical protein GWO13_11305 [Candidatus Bathyarchaeota archaeon]|nr:hypothetical protein [Candidatus Bathyarchaeota archaeon]